MILAHSYRLYYTENLYMALKKAGSLLVYMGFLHPGTRIPYPQQSPLLSASF